MMIVRKIAVALTVLIAVSVSSSVAAEVPHSFLGEWELDVKRTLAGYFEEARETPPEGMNRDDVDELASLAAQGEPSPDSRALVTITDNTISWRQDYSKLQVDVPYRVIGGNSVEIIVELFPPGGEPGLQTIRLVEDGLAMSKEDCSDDPDRCLRRKTARIEEKERRHAGLELSTRNTLDNDPSVATAATDSDTDLSRTPPSNLRTPQKELGEIQAQWTYLKKRE